MLTRSFINSQPKESILDSLLWRIKNHSPGVLILRAPFIRQNRFFPQVNENFNNPLSQLFVFHRAFSEFSTLSALVNKTQVGPSSCWIFSLKSVNWPKISLEISIRRRFKSAPSVPSRACSFKRLLNSWFDLCICCLCYSECVS